VRTVASFGLAAALAVLAGQFAAGQDDPKGPSLKAQEAFQQFRALMGQGRFDLAAAYLQAFLDANPSDQDLLELEKKHGTTVFESLRNVPKWSDDPKTDKQARDNVEALIKRARAVVEKQLRDPARVNKYIRNLGATFEERVYAEQELRRTGDFAVPFMVDTLRNPPDPEVATGILRAITKLDAPAVAGWIAALDGLTPDQQFSVLSGITSRPDALNLTTAAQTDFTPFLWRVAALPPDASPAFRRLALDVLNRVYDGTADRRHPEAELVGIARTFQDHKARYQGAKANPDGTPAQVPLWVWDAAAQKLTKLENVPAPQADEHFGLRYARWALEQKPTFEPAQRLILSLAAERAVERGNFAHLARTDPAVYRMLTDAPPGLLTDLLDQAMGQKRTALVLALTQALADRADKGAVTPRPGPTPRPSLLEQALNYPDPRVQLAAADGLLRSTVPVPPAVRGRVVEVLRRAAAADPGVPGGSKGTALLADPNKQRADDTAVLLRSLGYEVEVFATGRDLLRRVAKASDFDLILVDRHVVFPELIDVVGHLRADANAARRPVLVVASSDTPRLPSIDQLLLRFALLVAATETEPVDMAPPYVPNLRRTPEEMETERVNLQIRRDGAFRVLAQARIGRIARLLETLGLELTPAQKAAVALRVEQITAAVLAAEYPLSPETAPETYRKFVELNRQIAIQPPTPEYLRRAGRDKLAALILRLEEDVMKNEPARRKYEELRPRIDVEALGLRVESTRDEEAEFRVARQLQNYPRVRVIPEPYSRTWLEEDVKAAFADPADAPRDPAEKRAGAKLAVEWLSRMATGGLPGFDVRSAVPELRAALRVDDFAEPAIEALPRFGTAEVQQDLLNLALTEGRPLPLRIKAADATIRHIQTHGRLIPQSLIDALVAQPRPDPNPELRGKLMVIRGLLVSNPNAFLADLRNYSPPIVPPPKEPKEPGKEPGKDPMEPDKEKDKGPDKGPPPTGAPVSKPKQ
jgi:CheY-like chemotaxis protein